MKVISRILGWFLGVAIVLLIATTGLGYLWLRTSLPEQSGVRVLAARDGLDAPATIARDRDGIVHIHADSQAAAYFALGFAHAQDRLWQMETMRRLGTGELAEISGPRLVARDRLMRVLGLYRLAAASFDHLAPEVQAAIDAYVRGVNAFLAHRRGALPPEFELTRITPAPWTRADTLIWGRLMGLALSFNWRREVARAGLGRVLPRAAVDALWPTDPPGSPVTVRDADQRAAIAVPPPARTAPRLSDPDPTGDDPVAVALLDRLARVLPPPPAADGASNAWAVAGSRTASGKPILANDPHLRLRVPNLWYLARITAPGLSVAGATVPGVPFHILGHNGHIAWGLSTTGADTQDLVIERLAPDGAGYVAPGGTRPFASRDEVIAVRGAPPQRLTVRETRNGPVVSDLAAMDDGLVPEGAVVALRSTALAADDRTAEAIYRINRARGWDGFTAALRLFHSPVQNITYADAEGNIGFSVAGRVPLRRHGDGLSPVEGSRAEDDWVGLIPPDALPRAFNPARGFLANANNRVAGPAYPYLIARDWEAPYRALRIEQVLAASPRHDVAASRSLLFDTVDLAARSLLPHFLRLTPRDGARGPALDILAAWDGRARRDGAAPLIFTAWFRAAMAAVFADELGPEFDRFGRLRPVLMLRVLTAEPHWCDDRTTTPTEDCGTALGTALDRALAELRADFGDAMEAWRWGDAHRVVLTNTALNWIPVIGAMTRLGIATDGDDFTINRGTSAIASRHPYRHVHGATYRAIYDFADLDRSLFIHPTGQSGNPLSPHYRDLLRRWRDGGFVTIPSDPGPRARTLVLRPAPPGS